MINERYIVRGKLELKQYPELPRYYVDTTGSVYSSNYGGSKTFRVLKQSTDKDGYKFVRLVVNGKMHKRLVHRMILLSFEENPENKPQVNHLNGIRDDNKLSNLEWATAKERLLQDRNEEIVKHRLDKECLRGKVGAYENIFAHHNVSLFAKD